jgi:hypothetical protein
MPACDAKGLDVACQKAFSDSGCYPYCMAARKRGGRNNGLTLFSGTDWDNNIQLMDHDCSANIVVEKASNVVEFYGNRSSPAYYTYKGLTYSNLDMIDGQFVFSQSWDPTSQTCTYNPTTTSRVQRGTAVTKGADLEKFTAVLGREQPFAFAGETSLTLVREVVDNFVTYAIRVKRLYGQQGTGFVSMVLVNSALGATGPCTTQSDCGTSAGYETNVRSALATIPYSVFSDPSIHNPAAMTKWGVIYATNPSYAMFSQHFKRCHGGATDVEFMLTSSAGPTRLWRVNAFAYDDPEGVRAVQTGKVVEIPDGFQWSSENGDDICGMVFNVRVTSMEYLNDQNVAVQVLRASSSHFNPIKNTFENSDLLGVDGNTWITYRTYFLNPETMRLRMDVMWEEDEALSELGQGLLCPSQRRMPDFGSMGAEILAAVTYAARMIVELIFTGPAVFTPGAYSRIKTMNLPINYGHSFLLGQGMGWLNFDPFFDSLRRAHQHFWNIFIKVGSLFDDTPYVNMFLNGFAMYNQDYTPLVTKNMQVYMGAMSRAAKSVDDQIVGMVSSVAGANPVVYTGLAASAGMINMAHYSCRMFQTLIIQILFPAIDAGVLGESTAPIVHGLWQVVYESQENYKTLILASEMRSCVGLQLMMGQTNPIGRFAGAVCQAGVMFKLGAVETALAFFVDLPMLGCLCSESDQRDYRQWAMDNCWEAAPSQFKGVVYTIIQEADSLKAMCETSSTRVQGRISDAMNPFLDASYRASGTLADTVDYMRFIWDETAGSCRDFAGDPFVTTIIPDPIEFWRICAWTKTCKSKCIGSITTFEEAKDSYGVRIRDVNRVTSQSTIESAFFSDMDIIASRTNAPFDVLEMSEMRDCYYTCGRNDAKLGDRCVAILGLEYGGVDGVDDLMPSIAVYEYCVPLRLDAHVWLARKWYVANSHTWVVGMIEVRLAQQGPEYCGNMGFTGAFCSVAVATTTSVSLYREDGSQYIVEAYSAVPQDRTRLTTVYRIAVLGNDMMLVHGLGFLNGIDSPKVSRSLCINMDKFDNYIWGRFGVAECEQNIIDVQTMDLPVCVFDRFGVCTEMLLIPTKEELDIVLCGFVNKKDGILHPRSNCQKFPLAKGAVRQAGLYNIISIPLMGTFTTKIQQRRSDIVVASSISSIGLQKLSNFEEYSVFVANHPKQHLNWLAVMRIDTRVRVINFHSGARLSNR